MNEYKNLNNPLKQSIKNLKGIGLKKEFLFKNLNIYTIEDLLFYFPTSWEYRENSDKELPSYVKKNEIYYGKVIESNELYTRTNIKIFKVKILTKENKIIEANFFRKNNRYFDVFYKIKKDFLIGNLVCLISKPSEDFFYNKIKPEEYYVLEKENDLNNIKKIIPIYPLTQGIDQKIIRNSVEFVLNNFLDQIKEFINDKIILQRNLMDRLTALKELHFPTSLENLQKARERFIYEEFLIMSLAWAIKKEKNLNIKKSFKYEIKKNLLTPFKNNLNFNFTLSQKRIINEIFLDLQKEKPMSRLLQGEVGSGKTVIALSAMLLAIENNYQCAFMAPTEILTEQHFITFKKFLSNLPVKVELLTSSIPKKKKEEIITKTINGEIDILIGTHSIIEDNVKFKNLSLIIIDEQHRFGVRQRTLLKEKGENIDLLVMTATPIPRTLALSLYGDLDLSTLKEIPKGRKEIKTYHLKREEVYEKIKKLLQEKKQAYIVYPVIEESDDLKSLKKEYVKLVEYFHPFNVKMIHGKMKAKEKQDIMKEFSIGNINLLLATQVIEVGIDVPNACAIAIENAERFGLASLHQLRGRVGRGKNESFCFLISDVKNGDAYERIETLTLTNDGFKLSEKDAYIRGIGEILGTKQHGDIQFKIASIYEDKEIFYNSLEDTDIILKEDFNLLKEENKKLKEEIFKVYHKDDFISLN